jgi:YggT family protein
MSGAGAGPWIVADGTRPVRAGVDGNMGEFITTFFVILVRILIFAIVGRALLSWFPMNPNNPLVRVLNEITEPILEPLRRVIPRLGIIDLTPMIAIVLLMAVGELLNNT